MLTLVQTTPEHWGIYVEDIGSTQKLVDLL